MKIKAKKAYLVQALSMLAGIKSKNSPLEILENVLIDAREPNLLKMTVTNLNITTSASIPVNTSEPGITTVPVKVLNRVIGGFPVDDVSISDKKDIVMIKGASSKYKLKTIAHDDFPAIPVMPKESMELDADVVADSIHRTAFSVGKEGNAVVQGALFKCDGEKLIMVSTDGHRLSSTEHEFAGGEICTIIPGSALIDIRKMAELDVDSISIAEGDGRVFFSMDAKLDLLDTMSVMLSVGVVDGEYVDYGKLLSPRQNVATMDRDELIIALRRSMVLPTDKHTRLSFSDGRLTIESVGSQIGNSSEEIDANYTGEGVDMGVNPKYLLDAVNALNDEEIRLEFDDGKSQIIVRDGKGEFVGVVMPKSLK